MEPLECCWIAGKSLKLRLEDIGGKDQQPLFLPILFLLSGPTQLCQNLNLRYPAQWTGCLSDMTSRSSIMKLTVLFSLREPSRHTWSQGGLREDRVSESMCVNSDKVYYQGGGGPSNFKWCSSATQVLLEVRTTWEAKKASAAKAACKGLKQSRSCLHFISYFVHLFEYCVFSLL